MDKLKKSIFLPELPVKEPPKLIAPKIVLDIPMRDSPAQPTNKSLEDTEVVEIETVEIPEPDEIMDSSEGNFMLDTILRNVLNDANVAYPFPFTILRWKS